MKNPFSRTKPKNHANGSDKFKIFFIDDPDDPHYYSYCTYCDTSVLFKSTDDALRYAVHHLQTEHPDNNIHIHLER